MDGKSKSRELLNILENTGASLEHRKFQGHAATTAETLINYILKDDVNAYICGSFSEGSITPGIVQDIDVVLCIDTTPVVFDITDKKPGICYLAVQTNHPGYVKLRLLKDGKAATKREIDDKYHVHFKDDDDEAMYLSHKYISHFNDILPCAFTRAPALTLKGKDQEHLFDLVPALKSKNIPPYANKWITKFISSDWLSEEQVDKMKQMGCMFVGVSFPNANPSEIEWRLSFVKQERFLMSEILNNVQLKVYILLKILKNNILDEIRSDDCKSAKKEETEEKKEPISSYDCKTCLLHVIENAPKDIWSEKNLIGCLERCLAYLRDRLNEEKCTNFFVDEQNLFDRERIRNSKALLIEKLDQISKMNPCSLFDLVAKVIRETEMTSSDIKIYHFRTEQTLIGIFVLVRDLLLYQVRPASYESLRELLLDVEKSTDDNLKDAFAYVKPWIEIRMGMCLAAKAVQQLENAFEHLQKGVEADLLNVPLARSSILFQLQRYQDCLAVLEEVENRITESKSTVDACYCNLPSKFKEVPASFQIHYESTIPKKWGDKGENEIRKNLFAGCFCFLQSEEALIPKPLRNEMELCKNENKGTLYDYGRSWVMVDAIVYLHTLFYLVGEATADRQTQIGAIEKLTEVLQHNEHLSHKEVGYNILGWIMIQENKYLAAVRYFLKSWELRPYNNAAKYHIQELFGSLNEDGRLADDQKRILLQVICSALQLLSE